MVRSPALLFGLALACAHVGERDVRDASRRTARAIARGDMSRVRAQVLPGLRSRVDYHALDQGKRTWSSALNRPIHVRTEGTLLLTDEEPVRVVLTERGWRFAEDPTSFYPRETPRQALRTLVRATRSERWDVVLTLAPRRYRIGLSKEDVARVWTRGEQAKALAGARDRLARHLADPILVDAHEAVLELGYGHKVWLEREADGWVVVDF